MISLNPTFAAEAVNTLIDVYQKFNLQGDRAPGSADFFKQEIDNLDQEINAYSAQLATYKQEHGIGNLDKERELRSQGQRARQAVESMARQAGLKVAFRQ